MDDEGTFTPPNPIMFGNIDYDFMDQLLGEGCWLQTADMHPGQGSLPSSEAPSSSLSTAPPPNEERERCTQTLAIKSPIDCSWEGDDELNRIMWIGPQGNSGGGLTSVQERLMRAISNLREMNRNRDVLIQLWIPIKKGLKSFLTTVKQPHFFHPTSTRLLHFRDVSEKYEFPTDEHTKQSLGLPGRVFLGKAPEWTPNVCFFKQDEYPRVNFAHVLDVRASIALPVFETGCGDCLGVVEVIMTTENINYRPELESVCKALESVNLRSSEMLNMNHGGIPSYETVLPDILNVLRIVCDTHHLPLAQTWAPCFEQGKVGCWNSDKNGLCVSTVDSACYVRDERVLDFHRACSDHHLLKGRGGIVGKAFETNQPCFATDVTEFSKGDYPLSHHAKMFGLRAALAVRLHGVYHKSSDYVLEFYLPPMEKGLTLHDRICQSLKTAIHQHCKSLQFITVTDKDDIKQQHVSFPWFPQPQPQRKGKEVALSLDFGEGEEATSSKGFKLNWSNSVTETDLQLGQAFSSSEHNIKQELSSEHIGNMGARRSSEKRRTKAQKTISLQVLRQYFAGSLKDAAKSIGVCPTTLKRICRQHGISRWPSRKIKKVDHSLRKLQMVIDSVQGAQGSIKLSSFYTNFPELNNNSNSNTHTQPRVDQFSSLNLNDQPKNNNQPSTQPEGSMLGSGATSSSSPSTSSTHTSTSSHCFSSGPKISDEPHLHLHLHQQQSSSKKQANQLPETSQSNTTHNEHPFHDITLTPPLPITTKSFRSRQVGAFKAKASFAEEKIRFTILPNMGFRDLQQEIIKRFQLEDLTNICIKYLDDDKEWVLLTCDDDLDECIDIHKSSGNHSIKLTLSPISTIGGGSVGSQDFS